MATLEEHLNTLSLKQIKNLVREHNLLSKIKLGQPKEALIARLLEHFEELQSLWFDLQLGYFEFQ